MMDMPVSPRKPDDWDEWPDSAKREWYKRNCTGNQILRLIAEEMGIDPREVEWAKNSTKRSAVSVLIEAEDHEQDE